MKQRLLNELKEARAEVEQIKQTASFGLRDFDWVLYQRLWNEHGEKLLTRN